MPYVSVHPMSPPEIVTTALPDDERIWVPQAPDVWFRPLMLNTLQGGWCNLLRVRRAGVLSRHRHPGTEGSYVFEPPGETHTLTVPDDVEEMITFFNISGCMYYVDEDGKHTGFEDVFTKIDMCADHYEKVGLGRDFVRQFVR